MSPILLCWISSHRRLGRNRRRHTPSWKLAASRKIGSQVTVGDGGWKSACAAQGLPVAYLPFEGEPHGFRQAKNIKRTLDAEFYFYSKIFGFDLADAVEPAEIENLP